MKEQAGSFKPAFLASALTGIFTILAAVATNFLTTKEPKLTYSITGSPALSSATETKRIFVADAVNSGRKEIGSVLVQISMAGGALSDVAYDSSPGVSLSATKGAQLLELRADMLNEGDHIKVSFLTTSTSPYIAPRIVVRAPGVQGQVKADENKKVLGLPQNVLPLLISMLVAAMASVAAFTTRGLATRIVGATPFFSQLERNELLAYICGAAGLLDEAAQFRAMSSPTYRGAADHLRMRWSERRHTGANVNAALRCILLIKAVSNNSIPTIRSTIDEISDQPLSDEDFNDLRKNALDEGEFPTQWRERVQLECEKLLT
jgi:hypothetical protein